MTTGDGLTVSAQGLGCMRMGDSARPGSTEEAADVIGRALDLGVTFLDTADMYDRGHNEEVVGRALRGRRDEAVLGTKFGVVRGDGDSFALRGDAAYVRQACEASLRRLGVDTIDVYYLHRRDPAVPIEETVAAMAELVAEGKVRHLGLSAVTGAELRAAHAVHPIAVVQSEWSLCNRELERMVPVCDELGVGVVSYAPQGRGLLGARLDSAGARLAELGPRYAELPSLLRKMADRRGVRPGQIALAWVHRQTEVWGLPVVPIPGTTRPEHLAENVAAAGIELDAEELALLDLGVTGAESGQPALRSHG
ncbi:aldo/keto reductase [Streptomyces sp. NPDC015346]|uniref:aldo/keto reductase n=1 Tax=Streptomyces sp. NPDC015346 TaxID=3364954 RepID=UPI0036FCD3DE